MEWNNTVEKQEKRGQGKKFLFPWRICVSTNSNDKNAAEAAGKEVV